MRSPAELDDCAVEIQVETAGGAWRKGSGYLIGPCRILTALHVLVGQEQVLAGGKVSLPKRVEVRAYGDYADAFGHPDVIIDRYVASVRAKARDGDFLWRAAGISWPPDGGPVPRFDLAILEIAPEAALKHMRNAPRVGCLRPDADIFCRGTGFPGWMVEVSGGVDISSPRPVTGTLTFGPANARGFHLFNAANGAPGDPLEWQRISGTAFFAPNGYELVGIASAVQPTAGNAGLWLTLLADLAEGDEFDPFWTAARIPRPSKRFAGGTAERVQFVIDPLPYLYEFDRIPPEDKVLDVFDPLPGEDPVNPPAAPEPEELRRPPVFLISGRRIDLPEEMVKRIQTNIAPGFIGPRDGDPATLAWR